MPRRSLIAVLVLAITVLVFPGAAQAITAKELRIDTLVGPKGDIPCRVDATLHAPDGASKANPVPAILATNGFGGDKGEFATLGKAYARRGYAFLAYTGLGFPNSGCKIQLDDPDYDGKAGSQLVSFLGGSKADVGGTKIDFIARDATSHDGVARDDDPRVGMIGGSYGGEIQFAIAGQDPRMDALVPQITWNDLSYSLTPNNTDFTRGVTSRTPGVAKLDWPTLFFGVGQGDGLQAALANQDSSHLGLCPNFDDRACPALLSAATLGYPDATGIEFLRHASVSSYVERIRIPTLLAQGEHDTLFDLQEAVATYESLRAQDTPVKMLWRSSGHSGGGIGKAESDSENPERAYESRMALEWFDFYLRGLGDAPKLDFEFFASHLPYTGDAAPAVGSVPSYPAGTDSELFLSGGDALVSGAGEVKAGSASFAAVAAAPGGTGGAFQPGAPAVEAPGTFASFTAKPLAADTVLAGIPRLTVSLDAPTFARTQGDPAGKLVLFAKLYDVAPDGTKVLPFNQLSAVRVADVTKPVSIELPGIVHSFAKGHTMRLTLTTSNATSKGNNVSGPVTVKVDPAARSVLTVPVLGPAIGPPGSGPNGSTPFQPSQTAKAPQPDGLGGPRPAPAAAALPSTAAQRTCRSRRSFRIRLRRAPRGDSIRRATVTVNGKRVKVVRRARRLRAPVDLRGLPKGTYRVVVTVRTRKGRTLRSARTYRTCVPRRK